jgi:phage/plasmid primase-like uncharacterized protein
LLNSKKSQSKTNEEVGKEALKNQNNHDYKKSVSIIKAAKDNNSSVQKARNTKQYLLPQLSITEIKEHFIAAIKDQSSFNSTKLNLAIDKAFDQPNQKIRFGVKNSNELCWYGEAGYIKDYKSGEIFKWGIGNIKIDDHAKFKIISKEEFELKQQQASEQREKTQQRKLQEKEEIAKKAGQYFNSYLESNRNNASNNKYLANKNIIDAKNIIGIKFTKNNQIVIPLTDTANKIHSLQYINQDGTKKFLKGGEKQGNFFLITKDDNNNKNLKQEKEIYLAEGFATAASIHQATNKPVAVCFDAGNIEHVLKNLKSAHPDKQFIIAADNDLWKEANIGRDKALIAASKYGAKVILPQFKYEHKDHLPTDFNDLHKLAGIDEVRKQILNNHEIEHHNATISNSNNHQIHKETGFGL